MRIIINKTILITLLVILLISCVKQPNKVIPESKFKEGDIVYFVSQQAIIESVEWNSYHNHHQYTLTYFDNNGVMRWSGRSMISESALSKERRSDE